MKGKNVWLLLFVLILSMVLVACGGGNNEPAAEESSSASESASGLPDLGGREITIAVENAYLPFNYIDPTSGDPAGWDSGRPHSRR